MGKNRRFEHDAIPVVSSACIARQLAMKAQRLTALKSQIFIFAKGERQAEDARQTGLA